MWFSAAIWLLAGYGYHDLLKDRGNYGQLTTAGKWCTLGLCLVAWQGFVVLKVIRRMPDNQGG